MIKKPASIRTRKGAQSGIVRSVTAPVGGLNARDSIADMPKTDAIILTNWWPLPGTVNQRSGVIAYKTGFSSAIRTLLPYTSTTVSKLYAATVSGIFDASIAGAVGANLLAITEGTLNKIIFTVAGGSYLIAVSGVDKMIQYNGAIWQFIDNLSVPAISGLATTELVYVSAYKRRLWFIQKNSMSAWYLPVASVGGALAAFPVGELFSRGGKLLAMVTWTHDGGRGPDDYQVFITTEGEVAVYTGTDPATDFALVGVYYIGKPVNARSIVEYGGDVLILTSLGLLPLSRALQEAGFKGDSAVSYKIDSLLSSYVRSYGSNTDWDSVIFSEENMLLLNIPVSSQGTSYQLAMNTVTKAWAMFDGWNAFCWAVWDKGLYFGGSTSVSKAWSGYSDYGANITSTAKTAYNYFQSPALKHFKLVRPIIQTNGNVTVSLGIDTDFDTTTEYSSATTALIGTNLWGTGLWSTAVWGADLTTLRDWRSVENKEGFAAALRLRVASKDVNVIWNSTDFLYQRGGVL